MSELQTFPWKEVSVLYNSETQKWAARGYACTAYGDTIEEACKRLTQMIDAKMKLELVKP